MNRYYEVRLIVSNVSSSLLFLLELLFASKTYIIAFFEGAKIILLTGLKKYMKNRLSILMYLSELLISNGFRNVDFY